LAQVWGLMGETNRNFDSSQEVFNTTSRFDVWEYEFTSPDSQPLLKSPLLCHYEGLSVPHENYTYIA